MIYNTNNKQLIKACILQIELKIWYNVGISCLSARKSAENVYLHLMLVSKKLAKHDLYKRYFCRKKKLKMTLYSAKIYF